MLGATVEARVYDYDIYKEMEGRLKADILVLKKRNFDLDYSLKKEGVKLRTLRQDEFTKTRLSSRCKDMLQSIEKTVISKQNERTTKINSFYDALNRKHENLRKREEREKEIEEVMMRAMSEKLQEEKEWLNICFVNIFLKKFLKNKMERLIAKNEVVETAYHKIRSNTDITDSKELITRFLNRERDYGALLETIADKEHVLENIKAEQDKLQQANHELTLESEVINEQSVRQIKDCGPLQKELDGLDHDLKNIKEKRDLMHKWAARFFCAFYGKTREQVMEKYNHRRGVEIIKDALQEIGKYTHQITNDEVLLPPRRTTPTPSTRSSSPPSPHSGPSTTTCWSATTGSRPPRTTTRCWRGRTGKRSTTAPRRPTTCSTTAGPRRRTTSRAASASKPN